MIKRLLALGLCLALLGSLTACQEAASGEEQAPVSSASTSTDLATDTDSATEADTADLSKDPADLSDLLAQGLDGSGSDSAPAPVEEPEEVTTRAARTYGLSMPSHPSSTEKATAKALKKYAKAMGDHLVVAEGAETAEEQRERLNELVAQQVSAIFLCPADAEAMEETVTALSQQGVAVLGFGNWDYTPEGMVSIVHSDDYNAGYVCGMDLAEHCPDGGDVLVLERIEYPALMERCIGFMEAAEESGVDLQILEELELDGGRKSVTKAVKTVLKESPQVVGIFAPRDKDAAAALAAVEGTGIWVYGGEGSPELKAKLSTSAAPTNLAGVGAQSPLAVAKTLLQSVNDHLDGESVEEDQMVGTFLITGKNVKKYGVDQWQ